MSLLEAEPAGGGDGLSTKEMAARLDLPLVPATIEGVRSKARRLVLTLTVAPDNGDEGNGAEIVTYEATVAGVGR
ncbi:hypothetical protein [Streptomyces sp. NPDC002205]|uniref:hypothetical protein n=1 Tax=Streptomyces sp. NPDC002205 TaxID=3154411 RepID=UPI00331BEF75